MVIKSVGYKNLSNNLEIKNIHFDKRKMLMVGNSGAGKTRVLKAIDIACKLASGTVRELSYGFELIMNFSILNSDKEELDYKWEILVDAGLKINKRLEESNIVILKERLEDNNGMIFEKNQNQTKIEGYDLVPETKENESLISQYRKVENIGRVYREFRAVYFRAFEQDMLETTDAETYFYACDFYKERKICPLKVVEGWSMSPFDQYGIIQEVNSEIYKKLSGKVLEAYQEIFPEVSEISYIPDVNRQYGIAINADEQWITQKNISSGMLKALWSIINIFTMPRNAVLLIDELENGLGVNCIENVSDFIFNERQDIQVIATSHHPYIINAISMDKWLIIKRQKNQITSYNAEDLSLGKSKHDAYLQLVNKLQSE